MKAVVVEIKEAYAAVLSDYGCITKIVNKNYAIGQVIDMKQNKVSNTRRRIFAIATSATAVFALFTVSAWAYFTPYYYVSLDVNPSIEYSVNRFERVIGVTAVNEDGAEILEDLNLQNETIDDAIEDTLNQVAANGYLSPTEQGGIMIATSCSDSASAERLALRIKEKAQDCVQNAGISAQIETVSVARERVTEAAQLGVTPGKLNLVQKLQESAVDPKSIIVEEWIDKPVKDIMKEIKANNDKNKTNNGNSNKSENANDSNSTTSGTTNQSENANDSNSTPGTTNKSNNANDSNSSSPGSTNKSNNGNDSNASSPISTKKVGNGKTS